MEKVYTYDPKKYFYQVTLIGYFMAALVIYSVIKLTLLGGGFLWYLALAASIYGAYSTFVRKAYVNQVIVNDDTVTFITGKKREEYDISKLQSFRIRGVSQDYQMYIRAEGSGHKGRYWITQREYNDRDDLVWEMGFIEKRVHPTDMKWSGRKDWYITRPCYAEQAAAEAEAAKNEKKDAPET